MRKISKSILTVSLLSPLSVYALGIGDISTQSGLNQVLRAEIPLIGSQEEDPANIRVGLASPEAFDRAGLDRPFFLTTLNFTPIQEANGSITVKVSSKDRIKEPFISFLLEVEWPKGTTMREFTILLDPPATMETTTAPLQTAPVARSEPVKPKGASASYATSPVTTVAQAVMPDQYGPVKKNDNLWQIAGRLIENSDITREQMMLALYDQNPKAFYKNNVNALMRGAVLDVPDEAVIRRRSADQAKSQFNEQNRLWSTANQSSSDSSPSSSDQPTQTATSDEPEAKLKLMTPTDDAQPEVSVEGGSADSTTGSENPGAQASMAMEMAASLEQENTEIRSRLEELESQVETLQKQIALKDAELAELQSKPVEPKPAPAAAVEKPAPAPEPAEEEMPIALYAGGALVLGLLAWLFGRRRKSGSSSPEPKKAARALEDESKPASARPMPEPAATSQPIEVEESTLLSEFTASEFSDLAESQAADPLTETDVYIAYGRYQQAEDLMTAALQDEPDNKTYQLKLLDIYFAAGKAAEFESYAESVQSLEHTDPGTWEQIVAMGSELCPASPLFGGSGEAAEPPTEDEPSDEPEIESFELEEPEPAIEEQTESAEDNELEIEVSAPEEQSEEESHKLPDIDNPDVSDFEEQIQTTKEDQTTEQVADAEPAKKADDFEFDFDLIQPDTGGSESTESDDQDRDEASTKLALVQAYLDMEDYESARETLQEVIAIGNDEQRAEAQAKLDRLDS